ncbi:hypothetical protein ONZ45_g7629 [Pleurotus djamor]|nr:hypothetical protein ONZ45_g7629 [Pleurotus djamor]
MVLATRYVPCLAILWISFNAIVSFILFEHLFSSEPRKEYTFLGDDFPARLEVPGIDAPVLLMTGVPTAHYALNGTIADHEWDHLLGGPVVIVRLGPQWRPFAITMLHSLHCLDFLRKGILRPPQDKISHFHVEHCANYLREAILCGADTTLIQPPMESYAPRPVERICRNWAAVYQTIRRNNEIFLASGEPGLYERNPATRQFLTLQDDALIGTELACILYGVFLCFAIRNIYMLRSRSYPLLMAFTVFTLCVTTIYMGVALNYSQKSLIDNPTDPGLLAIWPQVVVDSTFSINTWCTDAFLLYRCYVVWMGPLQIPVMILPVLIYTASVATSVALLVFSSHPGASYSSDLVQAFGASNWSLSLALNIILTLLISGRLLWHRARIQKVIGHRHGQVYTTIMAISIESAALYAAFEIIVLAVFLTNNPTENVFFPVAGNIQVCSSNYPYPLMINKLNEPKVIVPQFIIMRIAQGLSFTTQVTDPSDVSGLEFAPKLDSLGTEVEGGSNTFVGPKGSGSAHEVHELSVVKV